MMSFILFDCHLVNHATSQLMTGLKFLLTASYPDVSLLMKMCAQRKAGRRQRARRLADLVFNMAERVMADEYAIFKISSALFICEF